MTLTDWDSDHYGDVLRSSSRAVWDVYQAWRSAHPNETIVTFARWVERTTGHQLTEILNEDEFMFIAGTLGSDLDISVGILEGIDAWP